MINRPLVLAATTTLTGALTIAACGGSGTTKTTRAAATSATAVAVTTAVQVSTTHTSLGTILVAGTKRLTVYMFAADHAGASVCSGACAQVWPPVTTGGEPIATGGAIASKLSTITRSDGTKQVVYNGHPLYYFAEDAASGQTNGQGVDGFGAPWYVLSPDGNTIMGTAGAHTAAAKSETPASAPAPASSENSPPESTPPHLAAQEEKPVEQRAGEEKHAEEAPAHSESMTPAYKGTP